MRSFARKRATRAGHAVAQLTKMLATILVGTLISAPAWTAPEDPEDGGAWGPVTQWPMIPVSGANLPDGRIVAWASNERTSFPSGPEFTYTAVWDPQSNAFTEIPHPSHDMFCSHHVMLEDGKVFVSGGRNQGNSPWTSTFNPETNTWEVLPNMNRGRWYPTSVALADGTIMTTIGSGGGDTAELWNGNNSWNLLGNLDFDEPILNYSGHGERNWWPLMHLAPDGRIFHSGPTPDMHYIDTSGNGSMQQVATMTAWYPKHGTTVMYEEGKLLTAGGWINGGTLTSSAKAMTIDLNGPSPQITQIGDMVHARKFQNGVTLPNGEVLVVGGNTSGEKFSDNGSVFPVELWNPQTQQFREGAAMSVPRNYHSIALLMTDGRVLSAGGGLCNCSADHQDSQVYSPPYLFNADGSPASRPVLLSVPGVVTVGQTIDVSGSAGLTHFSLIKMSSTTHGVNSDLRYLKVNHTEASAGEYALTLHSNPNVLTPGYWMLFGLNAQGTPSVAKILRVSSQGSASGPPTIKQMATLTNDTDEHVAVNVVASDPDGDTLAFSATGLPPGLSINAASGIVHGIPSATGTFQTTISVTDNTHGNASTTFDWVIASTGVDYEYYEGTWDLLPDFDALTPVTTGTTTNFSIAPRLRDDNFGFRFTSRIVIDTGGTYTFYTASDDGSQLFINGAMVVDNDGLHAVQEQSGSISLSAGEHDITVTFFERGGGQSLTVSYAGPGITKTPIPDSVLRATGGGGASNNSPVLTNPGSRSDDVGTAVELVLSAFDADADPLTFTAINLPPGLTLNPATGVITGSATTDGVFATQLHVSDGALSNSVSLTWTIVPENQPPVLTNPGNQSDTTGDNVSLALTATDPNTDPLTFSATGLPPGAGIDPATGVISGVLTTAGTYATTVTVSDGEFSDSESFTWQVAAQNFPPQVTSPGDQTTTEGDTVSLFISASDPNNDPLTYSASGLPAGLGIDPVSGEISGTATTANSHTTTVTVSDGALMDSATFNWTVEAPPDPIVIAPINSEPAEVNTLVSFDASATGTGPLEYSWLFGDGTAATPFTTTSAASHTYTDSGMYLVTVTVRNAFEQTSRTFTQAIHEPLTAVAPTADSTIVFENVTGANRVWNVNPDNDSVTVINADTLSKVTEIAVPGRPTSLALSPAGEVWVVSKNSARLTRLDTTTLAAIGTQTFTPGSAPHALAFNPQGGTAYMSLTATGQILVLNATSGATVSSIDAGGNVRHLSVTADGQTLLASRFITPPLPGEDGASPSLTSGGNPVGGEVLVISTANETVTETIVLEHSNAQVSEHGGPGLPNYVRTAVISPDGLQAWVPSKQDNVLTGQLRNGASLDHDHTVRAISSHIDLSNNASSVAGRIDHDNASVASAAAFDQVGAYLFVALEGNRMIAAVDAYRGEELFRFASGRAPQGLVMAADGETLFVHNYLDRTVSAHDLSDLINAGSITQTTLATISTVASETLSSNVLLGKQHFFDALDPRLALESYMSCASCHNEGDSDGRVWDFTQFGEGVRNTTSLIGQGGTTNGPVHWTGNFDEIQDFEGQIRSFAGGTGLMTNGQFNAGTRSDPLGDPKAGINADLDALAAYVGSLSSVGASPHKSGGALTSQAQTGRNTFADENCGSCHSGAAFTDSALDVRHDIGTLTAASGQRIGAPLDGLDTPTLKGLWTTAPYLHDGSAPSIEDAIAAHTSISLTAQQRADVAAYLTQLDDAEGQPSANGQPTITNPGNQTNNEGDAVSLPINASDPDGDPLTYSASGLPPGTSLNGTLIEGTLTLPGTYTATVSVNDGRGGIASATFDWVVQTVSVNSPPTLANPGAQSTIEGQSDSLTLSASDPDGDPLTFGASGLPPGLSLNASTGTISGTATAAGTYSVTASVSDGQSSDSESFTWTVTQGNASSVDVSVAASADDAEEAPAGGVSLTSSDLELSEDKGNAQWVGIRFAGVNVPPGATITAAWVQFTVDEVSTDLASLNIHLQDTGNANSFSASALNISSRPRTPSVGWVPATWPSVGASGVDQRTPDISALIQHVVDRADWVNGNAMAVLITGTGRRAAESYNGDVSAVARLHVEYTASGGGNTPPTISSPGDQSGVIGETADITISANDADGDPLTFTANGLPADLTIDATSGRITGTLNEVGVFPVTVQVSDGSAQRSVAFNWTVTSGQANAVQTQVGATEDDAEERPSGSVTLTSSDLELTTDNGNVQTVGMRFADVGVPQGATVTHAYIQFQVDEPSSTTTNLEIRGQRTDNAASFTSNGFDLTNRLTTSASVSWSPGPWLTVGEAGPAQRTPDLAPVLDEVFARSGWQSGNALVLLVTGTGTQTAESFNGDPSAAPELYIEYTVASGGNTPPVLSNPGNQNGELGEAVSLPITATDADGDPLTYSASGLPASLSIDPSTGTLAGTLSETGVFSVTVTVADAQSTDSETFSWTVTDGSAQIVEARVNATEDDAEERVATGAVVLTSSDLELIDAGGEQLVGMRFTGLAIPQGATVSNAWIQFTVDEVYPQTTNLILRGQATGDADAFAASTFNLSSRAVTSSAVNWSVPYWATVGDAGPDQRTPNIAAVIQEIVNRGDWNSGSSLVILVSGSGLRTAEAFNGVPAAAPLLHVEFQ